MVLFILSLTTDRFVTKLKEGKRERSRSQLECAHRERASCAENYTRRQNSSRRQSRIWKPLCDSQLLMFTFRKFSYARRFLNRLY